jgi:hypothetical protein
LIDKNPVPYSFNTLSSTKHEGLPVCSGVLDFETIEASPLFDGDENYAVNVEKRRSEKGIIQDFIIATNGVTACYMWALPGGPVPL